MHRFSKNHSTISLDEQKQLESIKILVVGLGGLGGIVSEGLIRIGLYNIGICEFDLVEDSNLNRQLLSYEDNIGKPKIIECKNNLLRINKEINITTYEKLSVDNKVLLSELSNYDIVIDCLDNYESRLLLHELCSERDVKVVYGAIAGDYGYLGISSRDNKLIFDNKKGIETELGNPFYTPAIIGSMQIKLALDVLFDKPYIKKGFYHVDLNTFTIEKINLN